MGLLKVTGTVAIDQFWPYGESDADTNKVLVAVGDDAFEYRPHAGAAFAPTNVFAGASVVGKSGKKSAIDKKGRITVRLQGIDAPELHYKASPLPRTSNVTPKQRERFNEANRTKYRQPMGETATVELYNLLNRAGQVKIPCTVITAVEEPGDAFDTYGRFVGDVTVRVDGEDVNLNRWLVQEGWAFPAFYASMSADEIKTLLADATKNRKTAGRVWKLLKSKIGSLDTRWVYRGKGATPDKDADIGPIIMPKLFRRLVSFSAMKTAKMVSGSFRQYLADTQRKRQYSFFLTDEVLDQGVPASATYFLSDFFSINGRFTLKPEDLVFREESSRLVGPDGKKIVVW